MFSAPGERRAIVRSMRRDLGTRNLSIVALVAWVLVPSRLAWGADPSSRVRLEYANASTAHGGGTEREFRDRVALRLGIDPFDPEAMRAIVATLHDDKQRLVGDVVLRDKRGENTGHRTLTAKPSECGELLESAQQPSLRCA